MKYERVLEFTRYNSGTHFLDSGGDNGRIWQRSPPPNNVIDGESICLTGVLVEHFEEDEALNAAYREWVAERDGSWFETTSEFMEEMGYVSHRRGNTYNYENDMDQCFVYEAWGLEPDSDWYYSSDVIMTLFVHTGADVRGGYSPPLFGKWRCETNIPGLRLKYDCEAGDPAHEDAAEGFNGSDVSRWDVEKKGYEIETLENGSFRATKDDVVLTFSPYYYP